MPVFLGGAALTRKYVEEDCVDVYGSGRVAYARDAFDGLSLMDKTVTGGLDDHLAEAQAKRAGRPSVQKRSLGELPEIVDRPVDWEEIKLLRQELNQGVDVPEPPFWGARVIENIPLKTLVPYINETMLYQFHWGYKKSGKSRSEWAEWAAKEIRPIMHNMVERCEKESILKPQAVHGFWKCASENNSVVLFDQDGTTEVARFSFPRQNKEGGLCIADFFRDVDSEAQDVIGLQVVTVGEKASDVAREWFEADKYQDYLYLHGLSVEMAEAAAEYVHKRMREALGIGGDDAREIERILKQGYRGSRYSFGYPACPDMSQQRPMLDLLGADRVGLRMADEDQLHPEQSTAAIVVHHPQAKYFTI